MNKFFCLFLSLILLLCACSGTAEPTETTAPATEPEDTVPAPLCDGKTLKILAITSSFGVNTTELLYDIAKAEGVDEVIVGRLYISGGTLAQHINNALTQEPVYRYYKYTAEAFNTTENVPMLQGLKDEQWDIIFLQQSAAQAGQEESYTGLVVPLINYVKQNMPNPDARFIWNVTWAYQSDSTQSVFVNRFRGDQMYMYQEILDAARKHIEPLTEFSAMIPSGTAIQNARTSYFGDNLAKDTYHLNNLGRIIAGYTLYSILTGQELTEIHLNSAKSYDLPKEVVLSDADKKVIIESVNNAIRNPYSVTPSAYPTN